MSTATAIFPPQSAASNPPVARGVTFPSLMRAELTKLFSLKSTWILLAIAAVSIIGIGYFQATGSIDAFQRMTESMSQYGIAPEPLRWLSLEGLTVAMGFVALMGALAIATEYGTGTIHSTLAAAPKRLSVFFAKALTVAAVTFVVTTAASLIAVVAANSVYAGAGLTAPVALTSALGFAVIAGVFLAAIAVIGVGIGAVVRSPVGAIAAMVALLLAPVLIIAMIFGSDPTVFSGLSLDNVSRALLEMKGMSPTLALGTAWMWLAGWVAVSLAAGAVMFKRRDT